MSRDRNAGPAMRVAQDMRAADAPSVPGDMRQPDARSNRGGRTRIVVVGEFNSGKTTLVNTLVGSPVLTPSVITHTPHPTVVGFGAKPWLSAETAGRKRTQVAWDRLDDMAPGSILRLHVGAPVERLRRLSVVDTPGLGFADGASDHRSLQACRNADTVIWCTPAMQAWKASEEQTWLALPARVRACGILAVTFADEIASKGEVDRLMERLQFEAGPHFLSIVLANDCVALVLAATESAKAQGSRRRSSASRAAIGRTDAHLRR